MTGLSQLLETGWTGLAAATEALQTVSDNTANANTPGYNVESVNQTELPGIAGGPGYGTSVTSVQRAFDQFAFQQVVAAVSANQAAQVVENNGSALAALFPTASGGTGGIGAAIGNFFAAVNTLSQDPTSAPDREALLSQAQSLAGTFHSTAGQIAASLATVNSQIAAAVQQVNALTSEIAGLNQTIAQQPPGNPPNALLDQRDQLVQQLGQQLGVTVLPGEHGSVTVYSSGGALLVDGSNAFRLAAGAGPFSDGSVEVTSQSSGQDLTNTLTGGTLGGLVASRGQLVDAQNSVGALAAGLAASVNTQQSLGLDANGQLGQALFSLAGPTVYPASGNSGSGTLTASITDPAQFTPGDFILTKTAAGFEATNITTAQTTALGSGPTLSLDGMTLAVSGTIATGDSFKLEPTAAAGQSLAVATSDPSAIAAAAPYVVTAASGNRGNITATVGGPAASAALPPGAVSVPATAFGQTLSVKFTSATDFTVETSSGAVLASGAVSATQGAEIAIAFPSPAPAGEVETIDLSSGTAAAGDSFTLAPGGQGSNGNIALMAGLADQTAISGQTLGNAYAALVTTLGSRGQEAQTAAAAAQGVLTQAQQTQQSVSGVNLDEEAAHLVAYQQAYQAAAQVVATAQTLFQSLLTAVQAA
jgi:flagellar hook-associated protein 1 FlgK